MNKMIAPTWTKECWWHIMYNLMNIYDLMRTSVQLRLLEMTIKRQRLVQQSYTVERKNKSSFLISNTLDNITKSRFYVFLFIIYLTAPGLSWGMWDSLTWPGIKPGPPALRVQSFCHWTTREVLKSHFQDYSLLWLILNDTDQVTKMSKPVKNLNQKFPTFFLGDLKWVIST